MTNGSLADVALQDPEVSGPRPDCLRVSAGHRARDLGDVRQVVHHPRCQQLPHRHRSKLRMLAGELHILLFEIPTPQRGDVLRAQLVKLLQQLPERTRRLQPCDSIEWIEAAILPLLENDARARNPVRALTVYQMRDNLARAPRIRPFVDPRP